MGKFFKKQKNKTKAPAKKGGASIRAAKPSELGRIDVPFLLLVLALLGIGLIMVASSSYVSAYYSKGDSYYFIKRQLLFAIAGIVVMFVVAFIDYHRLRKFAFPILIIAIIMLVLVLIPGIGVKVNGARRWLNFGVQFQPSEIGKFAIIVSFASYISANYKHMKKFTVGVMPLLVMLGTVVFLVAIETHLSGAILILAIGAIMMFVGGVAMKWFAAAIGIGVAGLTGLILFTPYMQSRINMWLNPYSDPQGAGYQIIQSLYAIGSGGPLGLGLGQSKQKHLYIPEPYNDYIFSITAEELGFVGALLIILLFVMLIWRGYKIAFHSRDKFGAMLVIGIVSRIAVQTILNIAVVTNAMPSTGIGLPFFSYGGTSLVVLMFEIGVVLSVSRYAYMDKV
ncbi:MAG: putative lipid II flippase FtsW [Clostridia bacterium]|nr:putative lipid II flippase FtsW [Clostridia bacterium]